MEITIPASPSKNIQPAIPTVRAFPVCDRFTMETSSGIEQRTLIALTLDSKRMFPVLLLGSQQRSRGILSHL